MNEEAIQTQRNRVIKLYANFLELQPKVTYDSAQYNELLDESSKLDEMLTEKFAVKKTSRFNIPENI